MAKKRRKNHRNNEQEDLVKVDIFYIPKAQAEMYQVLRDAIAEDVESILKEIYPKVERVQDPDEGEAVVAYDDYDLEVGRLYLNPANISDGQVARDKGQLDKFLETHILTS
ncbi:hypothetical protein ACF3NG_08250 [Aerococcaceae bacterium WGS1372]